MRRTVPALAVVAVLVVIGVPGSKDLPAAAGRKARALNSTLHRWLVESGTMRCDRCGPPRKLDVWKLLRGP
ncbi:MAG: hypothetical protein ACHQ1G_11225 [Planctomycetota bacterium]